MERMLTLHPKTVKRFFMHFYHGDIYYSNNSLLLLVTNNQKPATRNFSQPPIEGAPPGRASVMDSPCPTMLPGGCRRPFPDLYRNVISLM